MGGVLRGNRGIADSSALPGKVAEPFYAQSLQRLQDSVVFFFSGVASIAVEYFLFEYVFGYFVHHELFLTNLLFGSICFLSESNARSFFFDFLDFCIFKFFVFHKNTNKKRTSKRTKIKIKNQENQENQEKRKKRNEQEEERDRCHRVGGKRVTK